MKNVQFRQIPAWKSVFKAQEDCCYERVVYEGPDAGIYTIMDRQNEFVGRLLCYCDPKLVILPISKAQYDAEYEAVRQRKTS